MDSISSTPGITHGFGKHIGDLPEDKTTVLYYSKLLNWNLDLNYAFSLGSSKLSVLMLYWRVFGISTIRTPIKVLCVLSILWIIFRVCQELPAGYLIPFPPLTVCFSILTTRSEKVRIGI